VINGLRMGGDVDDHLADDTGFDGMGGRSLFQWVAVQW
jgi:hypothetical protein